MISELSWHSHRTIKSTFEGLQRHVCCSACTQKLFTGVSEANLLPEASCLRRKVRSANLEGDLA